MLIRFSVENFLSFNDKVEFSMLPGRGKLLPNHKIVLENGNDINVLKNAIFYGANASGKSNLIWAIRFAKTYIINGLKYNEPIPIKPFKLATDSLKKPSYFEFEFKKKNQNYAYGFTIYDNTVLEEWLYEINKTKEKPIFERKTFKKNNIKVEPNIKFVNEKEKGFFHYLAKGCPPNKLFLTECNERNLRSIHQINDVFSWFKENLIVIFPHSKYGGLEFGIKYDIEFSNRLSNLIKSLDTGIWGIESKELSEIEIEIDFKEIPKMIINDIMKSVKPKATGILSSPNDKSYLLETDESKQIKISKIMTKHKMKDSAASVDFELDEESDGTLRLLDLLPAFLAINKEDKVIVIDELDRSLHPLLSSAIIEIFNNFSKESQLIATTHDINLLDFDLLRKDEIWFIEKNKYGESKIYSLEEFKPRYDKDIRKGYLLGRFGAIPITSKIFSES